MTYSLNSAANVDMRFAIDSYGNLTVISPLDRETTPSYTLQVTARDNPVTGIPKESIVLIVITVLDINDNKPRFKKKTCSFIISDEEPVSKVIGAVDATDPDSNENAYLQYKAIDVDNTEFTEHFILSSRTGEIAVNKSLELTNEQSKVVNFIVVAKDNGSTSLNESITCTIRIEKVYKELLPLNGRWIFICINKPCAIVRCRSYLLI